MGSLGQQVRAFAGTGNPRAPWARMEVYPNSLGPFLAGKLKEQSLVLVFHSNFEL